MYLQKGRFTTAIRAKKHPQLARRNRKWAVPKNWHQFALLFSDWIVQIATFNCNTTLNAINPAHTQKNRNLQPVAEKKNQNSPKRAHKMFDKLPSWNENYIENFLSNWT